MRGRVFALLLALALVVGLTAGVRAQTTLTTVEVSGLQNVIVSADGVVAVCTAADAGNAGSKRCLVIGSQTTGGTPVHALLRVQKAPNGIFIDLVIDGTLAQLDTRVGSMDLSSRGHPSPTEDAVDTAALAAAD